MSDALHYDGLSATRHAVRVRPFADGFRLEGDAVPPDLYRWSDVAALGQAGGRSTYGIKGRQGWRLIFDGPPPEDFAIHLPLPARYGRWIDRIGLTRAVLLFAAVAAALVLVVLKAPAWVAPYVPRAWENRLGDAMVGDLGGRTCATPGGSAALDRLAAELGGDAAGVRSVEVVDMGLVNAAALPGGRIVIFRGLIEKAGSSDEVAGVLAHEIGHVRNRDVMAALIRQFGLSILLGGADGGAAGALGGLLSLTYSRAAESEADAYAIAALRDAAIAPDATAAFFDRLSGGSGGERIERTMGWLSSHPVSAERKAAFTNSRIEGKAYRPALPASEWRALRGICG